MIRVMNDMEKYTHFLLFFFLFAFLFSKKMMHQLIWSPVQIVDGILMWKVW